MDMFAQFEQEMADFLKTQGCKQCGAEGHVMVNGDWVCFAHWQKVLAAIQSEA